MAEARERDRLNMAMQQRLRETGARTEHQLGAPPKQNTPFRYTGQRERMAADGGSPPYARATDEASELRELREIFGDGERAHRSASSASPTGRRGILSAAEAADIGRVGGSPYYQTGFSATATLLRWVAWGVRAAACQLITAVACMPNAQASSLPRQITPSMRAVAGSPCSMVRARDTCMSSLCAWVNCRLASDACGHTAGWTLVIHTPFAPTPSHSQA